MTAQANTNLLLRNDTILGVCEAIGQDFGFNPTWLRIAFCAPVFWNPTAVAAVYLVLGLVVAATRLAFPDRHAQAQAPAAPAQLAEVEVRANEIVEERELIAA
jgi:phage shock protein C